MWEMYIKLFKKLMPALLAVWPRWKPLQRFGPLMGHRPVSLLDKCYNKSNRPETSDSSPPTFLKSTPERPAVTISLADRITGALLGGAVGDAIGAWYEGREPTPVFLVPPVLRITDDTQFTLATCEAILETGSVDPEVMARHFAGWYRQRRFSGVGASTLKALIESEAGGPWALVGATGERAAGNGAAMRAAPLAFFLDPDDETDRRTIRNVCSITHRHDEAYIGALAIIRTLRYLAAGGSLDDELWPHLIATLPDSRVRDRLIEIQALRPSIEDYALRYAATGYVVDSVPLALLAAVGGAAI